MDDLNKDLKKALTESYKTINNFFQFLEFHKNWEETSRIIEHVDNASIHDDVSARFEFLSKTYNCFIQNVPREDYLYYKYVLRHFLYLWQEDPKDAQYILENLKRNTALDNEKVLASIALYISIFQDKEAGEQFLKSRSEYALSNVMRLINFVQNDDYFSLKKAMADMWYIPTMIVECDKLTTLKRIEHVECQELEHVLGISFPKLDQTFRIIAKTPLKMRTPIKNLSSRDCPSILSLTPNIDMNDETILNGKDNISVDSSLDLLSNSFFSPVPIRKRNRALRMSFESHDLCDQTKMKHDRGDEWMSDYGDLETDLTLRCDPVEPENWQPDPLNDAMCEEEIEKLLHGMEEVELSYDDGNEIIDFLNCSRVENQICFGQYRCVRVLGEGGCSKVYEAINQDDEQRYAVKVMYYSQPASKKMVEEEIKIMKVMSATNRSIKVLDSRISKNGAVIVMEKAITDLKQFFADKGSNHPPTTILHYWVQMLLCVKEMHDRRISHLDLKLQNFVLTELGEVKLIDFGISRELAPDTSILCDKDGCGTIVFMSPELLREETIVYPKKCDVWAMGVVLYYLLFDTTPLFVNPARVLAVPEDPEGFKQYMLNPNYDIYYPRKSNRGPFFHELLAMTLERQVNERASVDQLIEKINSHF